MDVANEPEAETAGAEVDTAGEKEPKAARDEDESATGQRKTETVERGDVGTPDDRKPKTVPKTPSTRTVSPARLDEPPSRSQDTGGVDESDFMRVVERNAFIRNENSKILQQRDAFLRDLDNPQRPRRKIFIWSVGAVCGLIVVVALVWVLIVGAIGGCNTDEKALCTESNGTCSKQWYRSTCKCNTIGHKFYMKKCQYRCDYDPRGACPSGICYKTHCFRDVFEFVTFIYNETCVERATDPVCTVTCSEIVKHVCADKSSNPLFCNGSNPTALEHFSCQLGNASKGFIGLTSNKEKECLKDQYCKRVMTLYPCLAGYSSSGRVFCSKKCVVSQNRVGEPLFFNGYCVLKKANFSGAMTKLIENFLTGLRSDQPYTASDCADAMTKLENSLNGSAISYPYTADNFHNSRVWVQRNLKTFPNLTKLLYPLMVAYGMLGEEGKVSTKSDAPETASEFGETLKDDRNQQILKLMYSDNVDIVATLQKRIKQNLNADVYQDRYLRVASLVLGGDCRTFNECPRISGGRENIKVGTWAEKGGLYCSLSRALYITNLVVNATWCESIARLQGAAELSTKTVSFIYSPSFVSNLISQTNTVIGAKRLDDGVFKQSRALCDVDENVKQMQRSHTIIPMALSDVLGWVNDEQARPKKISSFALVLANAASVKKAICNEEDYVPSIDCELRLYLAFLAFLPEPSKEENQLVPSGDKGMVYFTLRAAMRQQLQGSQIPNGNKTQISPTNSAKVVEAAQHLLTQCLERVPN